MVEFVSYDGKWPCLCHGILKIKVDGEPYSFEYAMLSGGRICRDEDWDMWAEEGEWSIDLGEHPELEPYKDEITRVVNENVPYGCCGGCI
jgi:hypothetical protein